MPQLYRARWILPIASAPLRGGWILTEHGVVVGVGGGDPPSASRGGNAIDVVDLGDVVVLPGLVNAHTHLELSWMRARVPPGGSMPEWASRLMALRRTSQR